MTYIDHNHAIMPGTIMKCASCGTPRFAKQGQNARSGRALWYLGCECPAPSGVTAPFQGRVVHA